jgi:hypothetical protein
VKEFFKYKQNQLDWNNYNIVYIQLPIIKTANHPSCYKLVKQAGYKLNKIYKKKDFYNGYGQIRTAGKHKNFFDSKDLLTTLKFRWTGPRSKVYLNRFFYYLIKKN